MNKTDWIEGAGGGDSNEPTRTPDNLLSQDYFEVLLAVSEGPIKGLVYANPAVPTLENFYAGSTPAYSLATGKANFSDFLVTGYSGADSDPTIALKLGGQSSNLPVNVPLSNGVPVVRQTPSSSRNGFDTLEFRIQFSQLVTSNNDGTFENTAHLRISYKAASSSTWLDYQGQADTSVTGKTTSGYVKEFVINVPRVNEDYDLRVIKLSPDGTPGVDETIASFSWESVQMVKRGEVRFPDLAFAHIYGKASNQFSSLPEMSGVYDGMIVKVPTNYNPVTRTYDETVPWNGTMKDAYTNNGAWILFALITNPRWGLASYYKGVTANRYEFYEEAKWCDEPVDNGQGGTQPRFTFNELIAEAKSGLELLRYVAGSFNAIVYDDGNGAILLRSDRPREATQIFSPENVANGDFSYTFTDIPTRYNEITVTFVNPELDWEQDRRIATIDNTAAIAANGRIPFDFVAVGCTNSHEAVRRANYRYITANEEVTTVNFMTARAGLFTELMSVVYVADPLSDWSTGGRVKSVAGNIIQLRDPIYFPDTNPRTMKVQTFSGLSTITVVPPAIGAVYSLTITVGSFPSDVPDRTVFTIEDAVSIGFAKPFRVLSLEEVDGSPDKVRITALEIAANKYPDADAGATSGPVRYAYVQPGEALLPLTMVLDSPPPIINTDGSIQYQIEVSWKRPIGANSSRYEIDFRQDNDSTWTTKVAYGDRELLSPVQDGKTYVVRLYGVSPTGQRSQKCLQGTVMVLTKGGTLADVTGLAVTQSPNGWDISWNAISGLPDYDGVEIRIGAVGSVDYDSLPIKYKKLVGPQTMTWLTHGSYRIMAKHVDTSGNSSANLAYYDLTIANPATPVLTLNRGFSETHVQFQDCTTSQPLALVSVRQGLASSTFETATEAGSAGANQRAVLVHPSATNITHLFLRAQDVAGNVSNIAMEVIPAATGNVLELIEMITNGIATTNLSASLLSTVELITAPSSTAGSVAARVKAETDARVQAIADEAQARAAALTNSALNPAINAAASAATAAANASTLANLKNRSFYSATAPVSDSSYTLHIDDTWGDSSNSNRESRWNGSTWVLSADTRIAAAVVAIDNEVINRTTATTAEVNIRESLYAAMAGSGPYKVFNQATAPTGLVAADIGAVWSWKTASTDTFSRWSGSAWVTSVADRRAAVYRGSFATLPTTGNVIGDAARNSATNVVYTWNGGSWVSRTSTEPSFAFIEQESYIRATDIATEAGRITTLRTDFTNTVGPAGTLTSAVATEVQNRADGDDTVAGMVTTLASQVRGGYTGTDINSASLVSGLLFNERTTRAAADEALAQQITLLAAGATDAFDYLSIWYFDTTVEGWGTSVPGVTVSNNSGWLKLISNSGSVSDPWVQSPDNLGIDASKYQQVRARVRKYGTPTWEGKIYFRTVADDTIDETKSLAVTEPSFDSNDIALVTWHMPASWVGTVKRIRFDLGSAVTTANYYEIDWVAIGRPSPGASSAQLVQEQTARFDGDAVLAQDILDLSAVVNNGTTGVVATANALGTVKTLVEDGVTGLTATASRVGSLESRVNSPSATPGANYNPTYAALLTAYSTTAATNTAIANAVDSLEAVLNTGTGTYTSIVNAHALASSKSANHTGAAAPPLPWGVDDTWIDTGNGRVLKVYNGTDWVLGDDTRIGTHASQILTLQSSIQNGDTQFQPAVTYEFTNTVEGWIAGPVGAPSADSGNLVYQNASDTVGYIQRAFSAAEQYVGSTRPVMRVRVLAAATTAIDSLSITYFWGVSGQATKNVALPDGASIGTWYVVEIDFTNDASYTSNTINKIQISPKANALRTTWYDWVAIGKRGVGVSTAFVEQEATTRASETGYLGAAWSLKVATINAGATAEISGIAITGTNSGNAGTKFDMAFRANSFFFLPPAGQGNSAINPLIFYPSQTTVNGVVVPAGLYVKSAFIDYVSASRIDTRGLEVKDAQGNVILSAGNALDYTRINANSGWLNSNVGSTNMAWGAANGLFSVPNLQYGTSIAYLKQGGTNPHDLRPGETITLSADVWRDSTAAENNQTSTLYLYSTNAEGVWTRSAVLNGALQVAERKSSTFTLPSVLTDMTNVVMGLYHQGGGAAGDSTSRGVIYCDRIQAERGPSATLYSRGTEPGATVGAPTGTFVAGTPAATVVTNAASGASAWNKFSGAGSTLPAGNVEFNFAGSSSKGGNAANTDAVGSQSAATVQGATINFNNRNDRNGAAVVAPTVSNASGTVDHTLNTDGGADISFEWAWGGSEADIDGFIVYMHDNGATPPGSVHTFSGGANPDEVVLYLTPQRRAFITYGMAADHYYTFGVQAYRIVDPDISSTGFLRSAIAQPIASAVETVQGAYRPAANIAFGGNVTGTINGTSASTLVATANDAKAAADAAKLTADAAAQAILDIGSDNIISKGEKPAFIALINSLIAEQAGIDAQASALGITTEKNQYDTALATLVGYLGNRTPVAWNTVSGDTYVTGTTLLAYQTDLNTKKQALLNSISNAAAQRADWSLVAGAGKPADYATAGKSLALPLESWNLNGQTIATVSDGKVGNKVLRLAGPGGYPSQPGYVPIDKAKVYRTRFWARPVAAEGLLYFSLRQFTDSNGTYDSNPNYNDGRAPYKPSGQNANAHNTAYGTGAWGEYSYTWDARDWNLSTKYVQPEFLDNYLNAAGYWEVQDFTFEEITESTATTTLALVNDYGMKILGNTVEKVFPSYSWDSAVHSVASFAGGAFLSFVLAQANAHFMVGLNSDPSSSNEYSTIDYALYVLDNNTVMRHGQTSPQPYLTNYVVGDVLSLTYDGVNFRAYKNGALIDTYAASITDPLFLDSSFYSPGAKIIGLQFGPMTGIKAVTDAAAVAATTATWGGIPGTPPDTVRNSAIALTVTGGLVGAGGGQIKTIPVLDEGERETNRPPAEYNVGTTKEFKHAGAVGLSDADGYWITLETIKQYAQSQGGYPGYQYAYQHAKTWRRRSNDDTGTAWTAWVQDLDRAAYTGDLNATVGAQLGSNLKDSGGAVLADTAVKNSAISVSSATGAISGIGAGDGLSVANNRDSVINSPDNGVFISSNGVIGGAIKIKLPARVNVDYPMLRFTVDIYEYEHGRSCKLDIAGHLSGVTWYNVSANVTGGNTEYPVYFGHDGTYACVWIGDPGESWSYPQVRVHDVFVGYTSTGAALWSTGWQITMDQGARTNETRSVLDTYPGADWSKTARKPTSLAGINSTEANKLTGIQDGATVGAPSGTSVAGVDAATVRDNAARGDSAYSSIGGINTTLAAKLNKSGADTMTGPISLSAATAILVGTTNDGLYMGNTGLVGRKAGVTKFSLSAAGDAVFAGDITGGTMNINNRFIVNSAGAVSISSAGGGTRLEISNSVISVYDGTTLRVRMGVW